MSWAELRRIDSVGLNSGAKVRAMPSRTEKLEVTADEIGAQIAVLAQAYGREPKELAKALDRSGQVVTLAGDIIRGKALDLLVERADNEPEGPVESVADTEAEIRADEPDTETSSEEST